MSPGFRLIPPTDPRPRRDAGPPFQRLNGRWVALDFVNTVRAWRPGGTGGDGRDWRDRIDGDRLARAGDLVRWAEVEGLLDARNAALLRGAAGRMPREELDGLLGRARALRRALYRLAIAALEGWPPGTRDLAVLNRERERLGPGEIVGPEAGGYRIEWRSDEPRLEAVLWAVVRSATALLASQEGLARVGQCEGEACGWLFYDTPRGRPRRWCDSRDCGDVARVRAFRRRQDVERIGV